MERIGYGARRYQQISEVNIEQISLQEAMQPDKPWLGYLAFGACHAPHHVWKSEIDKYRGKFDMGYEKYRELVFERQKEMGIFPQDTELSPIDPYAQEKSVRPGINDNFKNPNVDEWVGRLETESREPYAKRNEIAAATGIKAGQIVADIGAGTGLFTAIFASRVRPADW